MRAADLSAKQIAEALLQLMTRIRNQTWPEEWDVVEEAVRRVKEHERLVRDVLPDLRSRVG